MPVTVLLQTTLKLPPGVKVDVIDEHRSVAFKDGKFEDEFPAYGVHLYMISEDK
jgi:hypothetical protein